jgi:hypothetical protein
MLASEKDAVVRNRASFDEQENPFFQWTHTIRVTS